MLLKKGAEANLYLEQWQGRKVIIKRRISKKYRIPEIDEEIRSRRTIHEPQLIHAAKEAGVPTPTIFMVDVTNASIFMEFITGKQIKEVLADLSLNEMSCLCKHVGELIGRLHNHGIVHGDLTTSNMILNQNNMLFLIDFGLSEKTKELEARGVDLHLMKRALQSSHHEQAKNCFKMVMDGYSSVVGNAERIKLLKKIQEIERRGRYVSER